MPENANDRIQDALLTHTVDILSLAKGEQQRVLEMLRSLEIQLVADLEQTTGKTAFKISQLKALQVQTRATIATAYRKIADSVGNTLARTAEVVQRTTAKIVNAAVGVDVMTVALSPHQLTAIAGKTLVEGKHPRKWWDKQSADLRRRFENAMREGMLKGEGIDALARRIRGTKAAGYSDGIMLASAGQARALARTSVMTAANEARIASFLANPAVIKGIQWIATLDDRTTPICRALDRLTWTLPDFTPEGHDKEFPGPIAHWQCFTGDVPVSSPSGASRLYRRPYSGELVTIETKNGRRLTATPNHPVLTPNGWLPVGQINVGEDLICQVGRGGRAAHVIPDDECRETTFAELAEATAKLLGVIAVKMPTASPDFHGDGTDGEVGEVWSYGALSREGNAALAKLLGDGNLHHRNIDAADALAGSGYLDRMLTRARDTANGIMRWLRIWLFAPSPTGVQVLTAGASDASRSTPSRQGRETDVELPGDFAGRDLIGDVERDRVCVVRRSKAVSVWVHNLETPTGFYFADGIASHNCRSTQIPVTKSWRELAGPKAKFKQPDGKTKTAEQLLQAKVKAVGMTPERAAQVKAEVRASMDGQVAGKLTFEGWLRGKLDAFQDRVLGPTRAKLWREGKITVPEMTDAANRPLTIAQLEALVSIKAAPPSSTINPLPAKLRADFAAAGTKKIPVGKLGLKREEPLIGGSEEKLMEIDINDIVLGRESLNPARMLLLQNQLPGKQIATRGVTLIIVTRNPETGHYVVSGDGNHRVAFLKLTGYRGKVPVIVIEPAK